MRRLITLIVTLLFTPNLFSFVTIKEQGDTLQLTTLYGTLQIHEPVLMELIKSAPFERLKHIHQYGVIRFAQPDKEYTRYQHSLGVFFVTRKFGAPLEEQIAALLHDVSHTVFSHVGDMFFKSDYRTAGKDSYQDGIHEWYLEQTGIAAILHRYGYDTACSSVHKNQQRCFDQKLPGLCSDRIEYNITGGYLDGLVTQQEAYALLNTLHFVDGEWFFEEVTSAKKFGLISLTLTESRWGGAYSAFIDYSAAQAMKRAHELSMITMQDIHFSIDDTVWDILTTSNDATIQQHLKHIKQCRHCCNVCAPEVAAMHVRGKFSGTDPQVMVEGKLIPLTLLDAEYKKEYERVKAMVTKGFDVSVTS